MKTFKDFLESSNFRLEQTLEPGENYGSLTFQRRLEDSKREKAKKERQKYNKERDALYTQRTAGSGIRSFHKGVPGWLKDGKFTPDER